MIETAGQRYRLRRDTMFSESSQGIYFSNSTSGFEICGDHAYRAFRAVYPLLEGEYTEAPHSLSTPGVGRVPPTLAMRLATSPESTSVSRLAV